jgi:hypothetical protein
MKLVLVLAFCWSAASVIALVLFNLLASFNRHE